MPQAAKMIDDQFASFNKIINEQDPYKMDVNIYDAKYPLNLTLTSPPELKSNSNLIKINFDGTFHDAKKDLRLQFKTIEELFMPELPNAHRQ